MSYPYYLQKCYNLLQCKQFILLFIQSLQAWCCTLYEKYQTFLTTGHKYEVLKQYTVKRRIKKLPSLEKRYEVIPYWWQCGLKTRRKIVRKFSSFHTGPPQFVISYKINHCTTTYKNVTKYPHTKHDF